MIAVIMPTLIAPGKKVKAITEGRRRGELELKKLLAENDGRKYRNEKKGGK